MSIPLSLHRRLVVRNSMVSFSKQSAKPSGHLLLVQPLATQEPVCRGNIAARHVPRCACHIVCSSRYHLMAAPVSFATHHSFRLRPALSYIHSARQSPPAARRLCSPAKPPAACRAGAGTGPRLFTCHAPALTVRPGTMWQDRPPQPVALADCTHCTGLCSFRLLRRAWHL